MTTAQKAERFGAVAALLPFELRRRVDELPERVKAQGEELRLRAGRPLSVVYPSGEVPIAGTQVSQEHLRAVLEIASGASVHTVMEQLKNGFVPVSGGHRLGLCGTAVVRDGALVNLRAISSVSLRVAREVTGISTAVIPRLIGESGLENTLILSPPGGGKTTLLRDLIRAVSIGEGCDPQRVGVVDERGELAAMVDGLPTLDLGPRTDVMDGCPKALGLSALVRGMNPQVLAVDEITAAEDVAAILQANGCGVKLLATAHAGNQSDLARRPLYRELLAENLFSRFVVIRGAGEDRSYTVFASEGREC